MSLFIGLLEFTDPASEQSVRIGVLAGSLLSAVWGAVLLRMVDFGPATADMARRAAPH
ncbi:MAG: Na+/H+ antiporter NhaA [Hyphomicrobiaceae bacterium]